VGIGGCSRKMAQELRLKCAAMAEKLAAAGVGISDIIGLCGRFVPSRTSQGQVWQATFN
jgi:hypothetical protein